MKRPTTKGNYTKQDLVKYAIWRKNQELEDAEKILNSDIDNREDHEDFRYPLAISKNIEVVIELSTGGDGDGFKIYYSKDGDLLHGVYYWQDWGVYEEVPLENDELDKIIDLYAIDSYIGY